MAFKWEEYILLAEDLNSGNPSDAKIRSAISRAYYGVFCVCRRKKEMTMDSAPDIHQRIISIYKNAESPCEHRIGNILDSLRIKRNKADYNAFEDFNKQSTNVIITQAKSIIELFQKIENNDVECD